VLPELHTESGRPCSNRRATRSGGNDAQGSTTVVRTFNVCRLIPACHDLDDRFLRHYFDGNPQISGNPG
jgi:hypothetical protein